MDPYETLKIARTIKKRGTDSFKRGQLPEAQRNYTEVLAMLTEEITFTGDDQRKEKETLVLTAHLNLAQCALRLGDDARAIYHCNTALGIDRNSAKAHYRKARAFENRSEIAEALEGYQHVLTLEPDNETVQKQVSECQKKLDCRKAEEQMSNTMTEQEEQDTEDEDVEVVYEDSENDPETRYKKCAKNPGHEKFISICDFKVEDLPPAYRDPELFDHIKKHQSEATVMLKVWPARKSRPGCGPGTERKNSRNPGPGKRVRPLKHGSGWLSGVTLHTEDEQPCPCQTCKNSGSPEKKWAVIVIMTAGHVVCNNKQANNTECYFLYDTEKVDLSSCPKLSGAVIYSRNASCDTCLLNFISHDVELLEQLWKIWDSHAFSHNSVRQKYQSAPLVEPEGSLLEQFEQLWQRLSELETEYGQLVEQLVAILTGDPRTELVKQKNIRKKKFGDYVLCRALADKLTGGVLYQELIEQLQNPRVNFSEKMKQLTKYVAQLREESYNENDLNRRVAMRRWQAWIKGLEMQVMELKHLLDENVPLPPPVEFNEDLRLTVIVSHPHGCSKKITIGETTERTTDKYYSQYTYTTPTCPGSSGANVFVLGETSALTIYPHSASKSGGSLRQLNESALSFSR